MPRPLGGSIKSDDVWRLTSVTYVGPKSRTERPRKTKIGRGSPRHTWLDRTPLSKSKIKVTRPLYSQPCWRIRQLQRWAWERVGRGKLLLHCRLLGGVRRFGAHGWGEGRGLSWRPPAYIQLVIFAYWLVNTTNNNKLSWCWQPARCV